MTLNGPTHRRGTARLRLAAALLAALTLAACGGDAATDDDDAGAEPAAAPPAADTPRTGASRADTASAPEPGGADRPAARPRSTSDTTVWSATPVSAPASGRLALLRDVRTARHGAYDRIVFEFADRIPGFDIRYHAGSPAQCGSGLPIDVRAPQALVIRLEPAVAHDEEGRPTVTDRDRSPDLPVLKTARIICDFEGIVEWGVGTTRRAPLRVLELISPPRLVVDLAHP